MTTEPQDDEAPPKPSYAAEGALAAQALAKALSAVLEACDYPAKAGPSAKRATQALGLYLAASEFLRDSPPAARLQFLGQLEQALFPASPDAPASRLGKLRLTPVATTPLSKKEPRQ